MSRSRLLGAVLLIFGLFAGGTLVLVDGSRQQFAERRVQLAHEGVRIDPVDVWVRSPSRPGQANRIIGYRFEPRPGAEPVDGADPVPVERVEALLAAGRPAVVFLPGRPEINALAATIAEFEAAGWAPARVRGWGFWLLAAMAAGLMAAGLALLARRRAAG